MGAGHGLGLGGGGLSGAGAYKRPVHLVVQHFAGDARGGRYIGAAFCRYPSHL